MTLLAKLDEGGMASVYLAGVGSGALSRLVAVKLLRADLVDDDHRTRFLDEARVVVRLHHNNLVNVRSAGEIDQQLYIAMEFVEGRNLADLWDRCADLGKAFPISLAVYMVREVLRGLHYAHTFPGLSLVHRDVSPSNVLLDWAGAVRLADFGLATSTLKDSLTLPGVVFGKIGYMSPEAASRQPVDRRADIFGCGVILWELLTGRPMRAAEELDANAVAKFKAVAPSRMSRRVDDELDNIVMKALRPSPDDRWSSADAMMTALSRWLAAHAPETSQEELAGFMNVLFGERREQEHLERESLLRVLATTAAEKPPAVGAVPQSEIHEPVGVLTNAEVLPEGQVVCDRYRVIEPIGKGGMGWVYRAEHMTVGRQVAIKVLGSEWSRNESVVERFRAEARAASAAGHPNIIEVFDAGELPDGRLFLVMEYLVGQNLFEIVRERGRLSPMRACYVVRETIKAIRAAHGVGVIHRDLKPDNVMLTDSGDPEQPRVKVLDFGISVSAERMPDQQRLTMPGHAVGTPEYMAPEQAKGHPANESFDIYSIGVIAYELLAGNPPFFGSNFMAVMAQKTTEPAPSLATHRENLPIELIELVDQCLEIDPNKRPASAAELLSRIESIMRGLEGHRSSRNAVAAKRGTQEAIASAGLHAAPERQRWIKPAIVAGLIGAAVLTGVVIRREPVATDERSVSRAAALGRQNAVNEANLETPAPTTAAAEVAVVTAGDGSVTSTAVQKTETAASASSLTTETSQELENSEDSGESDRRAAASRASANDEVCTRARAQLEDAIFANQPDVILKRVGHLDSEHCWRTRADRIERARAKVRAYKEQMRWDECVRAGASFRSDSEIKSAYELCRQRREKQG